ncbi:protein-L-isoaspartateD-aspartate O-methyltransferase [Backusella circina FSU 941]|nr:protein-L-isoaspartateD-aspartate O-methyltransferase [Backusella circina FSU 941]
MAWRCSADSNEGLVDNLRDASIISNQRVIDAMKAVDRGDFASRYAYEDRPQSIGYGATISAPHMHGYALNKLEPYLKPGMKVLDVGSGSGYLCACFAEMVGPTGAAIGIEHIPELVDSSVRNISKSHSQWITNGQIKMVKGDGRMGYEEEGPYDCIHVGAAAPILPQALINQLKAPGRLFIPVGTDSQHIMVYDKQQDGTLKQEKWMGVMYVPLTDADYQKSNIYK